MRTLLCFGDSNTHGSPPLPGGAPRQRHPPGVRWPTRLAERLGTDWQVIEEGLPGRTCAHDDPVEGAHRNGLAVLPAILESHRPLDAVVLMLGTNDLKPRFALTAADIASGVQRLAERILDTAEGRDSGIDGAAPVLLIVAPPHVQPDSPYDQEGIDMVERSIACSETIAAVADRLGTAFLDAGPLVGFGPEDGVHLDAAAHAMLGDAIAEALLAPMRQ